MRAFVFENFVSFAVFYCVHIFNDISSFKLLFHFLVTLFFLSPIVLSKENKVILKFVSYVRRCTRTIDYQRIESNTENYSVVTQSGVFFTRMSIVYMYKQTSMSLMLFQLKAFRLPFVCGTRRQAFGFILYLQAIAFCVRLEQWTTETSLAVTFERDKHKSSISALYNRHMKETVLLRLKHKTQQHK
ncbi:hypothetical protein BY458DRAFT_486199 [Sporodiniella umbellata]|nr:hypothetical protein BY458DRAFT_486199 [Sporodiniella umbellata]